MFSAMKVLAVLGILLTIESAFPSNWWRPDMVLLLLVPCALRLGRSQGAVVGFFGGAMLGAVSGSVMGVLAAAYGVIGYLLGCWGEREVPCLFVGLLGTVFAVSAVELILAAIARISPWTVTPSVSVLHGWMLPALLINSILIWPADRGLRLLLGRAALTKLRWRI